jgi:outer membrane protein OmpA-like peptidoglycan-associated protein
MEQAMRRVLALTLLSVAAAAGPAQAQSAAGTGSSMIFFPWNEPRIDRDAAAMLDNAAAAYRQSPGGAVRISGHSDRSGPAASNRRSAAARAEAVRAYLAGRGVPAAVMSVATFGEERPLIATEDGVREPQNRRVDITFGAGSER